MGIIITLLLVLSVGINVWFLKRKSASKNKSVHSTLLQGIKDIKDLATVRQSFQSIVMYEDTKSLLGIALPGTKRKFILKYSGVLTCGSDLSKIKITERFALNQVLITVPCTQLLDLYADMSSVQVYDQRAGLFTKICLQDQNREIVKNLEEVRHDALKGDILRRAAENVKVVLASLAATMGMDAVVVFEEIDDVPPLVSEKSSEENLLPASPVVVAE